MNKLQIALRMENETLHYRVPAADYDASLARLLRSLYITVTIGHLRHHFHKTGRVY